MKSLEEKIKNTLFKINFIANNNHEEYIKKYNKKTEMSIFLFTADFRSINSYDLYFNLEYKRADCESFQKIDLVRLCCELPEQYKMYEISKKIISKNNNQVWMIGRSNFYKKLEEVVDNPVIINDFLLRMNDLIYAPDKLWSLSKHLSLNNKDIISEGILGIDNYADNEKDNVRKLFEIASFIYSSREDSLFQNKDFLKVSSLASFFEHINQKDITLAYENKLLLKIAQDALNSTLCKNFLIIFFLYILSTKNSEIRDQLPKNILDDNINFSDNKLLINACSDKRYIINADLFLTLDEIASFYEKKGEYQLKALIDIILDDDNSKKIANYINNIKKTLKITEKEISGNLQFKLGQYTSASSLRYLIKPINEYSKTGVPSLRLSNLQQMNDPKEGKALYECIKKIINNIEEKDAILKNRGVYISSMTSELDKLPMWELYGDHAKGISMIYNSDYLCNIITQTDADIFRMCYITVNKFKDSNKHESGMFTTKISAAKVIDKDKKIVFENMDTEEKVINNNLNTLISILKEVMKKSKDTIKSRAVEMISSISYLFKYDYYSYENEFRLVRNLGSNIREVVADKNNLNSNSIPFLRTYIYKDTQRIKVTYQEVKIGCKGLPIDYVEPYVKYCYRNQKIIVSESDAPYR